MVPHRIAIGLAVVAALAVCAGTHPAGPRPVTTAAEIGVVAPDSGPQGAGPVQSVPCTMWVGSGQQADTAQPGAVVCLARNLDDDRLTITTGGTPDAPITYAGNGQSVNGIDIAADNVVVDGYTVNDAQAPAISMTGDNITLRDNTVANPHGGDGDGIRFFGDNLKILHNTITGTHNVDGAHADCMQTFASDTPTSQHVLIDSNKCQQVDNMCVIAEGPNTPDGSGIGQTEDITINNNYCQTLRASQALMFDDVQNLTITNNTFAAGPDHAIGLQDDSTGAHVSGNTVSPQINYEVGIDSSSLPGYVGPSPGGAP